MNPISLSYPFPFPFPLSFARSRESKGCPNSGFDRGVWGKGRGRYSLKSSIFASLLETKGTQNTLRPDHPESIFSLNHLFKITTVLFCALHSPVTYIYICNHALNWNVFKNRYFSTLTLHCWFAQQSCISLTRENITKTLDKHTLLDEEFDQTHTFRRRVCDQTHTFRRRVCDQTHTFRRRVCDQTHTFRRRVWSNTLLDGEFDQTHTFRRRVCDQTHTFRRRVCDQTHTFRRRVWSNTHF